VDDEIGGVTDGRAIRRIFDELSEPFPEGDIKVLNKGGRSFSYLDWPAGIRRLDAVLGPENWDFTLRPWGADALIGTLKVTLPNDVEVVRENVGGKPKMPGGDEDDRVKGAATDALKRCMMMFGVGLYLHDTHETPQSQPYRPRPEPSRAPTRQEVGKWYDKGGDQGGKPAETLRRPRDSRSFFAWMMKVKEVYSWDDILQDVDAAFKSGRYPKTYKDWTTEQVESGTKWVAEMCSKTETYRGEFDDILREAR